MFTYSGLPRKLNWRLERLSVAVVSGPSRLATVTSSLSNRPRTLCKKYSAPFCSKQAAKRFSPSAPLLVLPPRVQSPTAVRVMYSGSGSGVGVGSAVGTAVAVGSDETAGSVATGCCVGATVATGGCCTLSTRLPSPTASIHTMAAISSAPSTASARAIRRFWRCMRLRWALLIRFFPFLLLACGTRFPRNSCSFHAPACGSSMEKTFLFHMIISYIVPRRPRFVNVRLCKLWRFTVRNMQKRPPKHML